jgi:hypothetical protein
VSREVDGGINDTAAGILAGLGLQLLMIPAAIAAALIMGLAGSLGALSIGAGLPFSWGLSQMLYMGPAIVRARLRGNIGFSNGLCIAAIAVCILHVAFFVAFTGVDPWE